MQKITTSSFNRNKLQKPVMLLTSAVMSAVLMMISLSKVFLPYTNYFSPTDIIQFLLSFVVNTLLLSCCATFFASIGKFTFTEYIKWTIACSVFFHFLFAVRDLLTIMDFAYFTTTLIPGLRGALIYRLPITIVCIAGSIGLGVLLTKFLDRTASVESDE